MRKLIFMVLMILFSAVLGCTPSGSGGAGEGLDFPVQNVTDLNRFYCFGLQPWDTAGNNEIHGGIDLVSPENADPGVISRVPIVAPAAARVERIIESVSGAEVATLVVVLKMNDYWYIVLNFEPQTTSASIFQQQRDSIFVTEGQNVARGQVIGELVINSVKPGSYPHLHFGFFYKNPEDTLEDIYANYLSIRRSNGMDLAPLTGPGSPWQPTDLDIETTFYCPYEYSSTAAKTSYDRLPRMAADGSECNCICAYGSTNGDCGNCIFR